MSIAHVNSTGGGANILSSSTALALDSFSVSAGNAIIVGVTNWTASQPTVSTITDTAGNTYSRCGAVNGGDPNHSQETWIAHNIAAHANNVITITFTSSADYRMATAAQYSGLATSSAYDANSYVLTASGTTHTSSAVTTNQADELIIGWIGDGITNTLTMTSGTSRRVQGTTYFVDRIVSSVGSYSVAGTTTLTTQLSTQVRTFKMASAGSPPTTPAASGSAGNTTAIISLASGGVGATSFNIKWGTSSGSRTNTITGVTLPYTHTGRTNGTPYYYSIVAVNSDGSSESSEISVTPTVPPVKVPPRQYLAEITAYISGVATTLYFTTGTGINISGHQYEGRISNPGSLKYMMFADGTTMGESTIGYGTIELANNDGGLDYLISAGFSGRSLLIKELIAGSAVLLMSCSMEQPTFNNTTMSIRIKDPQLIMNIPIQPNKYGGTNSLPAGIDGVSDIKGKPKPLLYGQVSNATAVCVNTSKLIYQCNDGALQTISNVYDKGVALTPGVDRATNALLQANAPAAGTYDTCLAEGLFRLGSSPFGTVTFDALQGATAANRTAAQIAKTIALKALSSGDLVTQDFTDLDTLNSGVIGIYITNETLIPDVLDDVLGSIGGWFGFDSPGKLNVGRLDAPSGTPVATLTALEIKDLQRLTTSDEGRGLPTWKVNLNYSKNYTIQKTSDLAGTVAINGSGAIEGVEGSGTVVANTALTSDQIKTSTGWATLPASGATVGMTAAETTAFNMLSTQTDNKVSVYVRDATPSWTDADANHAGDRWYNTGDKKWYAYSGTVWSVTDSSVADVSTLAAGKTTTHYGTVTPTTEGVSGDYYVKNTGGVLSYYKKVGTIWTAWGSVADNATVGATWGVNIGGSNLPANNATQNQSDTTTNNAINTAATTSTWSGVSGGGKPADNATQNQSDATTNSAINTAATTATATGISGTLVTAQIGANQITQVYSATGTGDGIINVTVTIGTGEYAIILATRTGSQSTTSPGYGQRLKRGTTALRPTDGNYGGVSAGATTITLSDNPGAGTYTYYYDNYYYTINTDLTVFVLKR